LLTRRQRQMCIRDRVSAVMAHKAQLVAIFEQRTDATLAEYCELLYDQTGLWVSQSTMCRIFQRLNLPRKKNSARQSSKE
jgi:transposase